jgi:hypothetical protein
VRDVAEELRPDLERAGCRLVPDALAPVAGLWDSARLDQVLRSIQRHQVRAQQSSPCWSLSRRWGTSLGRRGFGIGIPPQHRRHVFGRFERTLPGYPVHLVESLGAAPAWRSADPFADRASDGRRVRRRFLPPVAVAACPNASRAFLAKVADT